MILLTGATGNTGSPLARLLQARGIPFKALVRSESRRQMLQAQNIDCVDGDFDRPATLDTALRGVERAYLVCTPDEQLARREIAFIDAAERAGVRRIVKCSAYLAGVNERTENLRSHGRIEERLARSSLEWTSLRPHGFMQTFVLLSWPTIQQGAYMQPAGDGRMPLIDVRDVAQAALKALLEDGHHGRTYDLTGPEALSFSEQASIMTRVLGHQVRYLNTAPWEFEGMLSLLGARGAPADHAIKIMQMTREHVFDMTESGLQEIGVSPTRFETYLTDLKKGVTGGGNSFQPPDNWKVRLLMKGMPALIKIRLALT